jgi:hypothetical protein
LKINTGAPLKIKPETDCSVSQRAAINLKPLSCKRRASVPYRR